MPSKKLPDGFPDPEVILKDNNWEQTFPKLILRGIYDVMKRERDAGRGSLRECYVKGFNVVMFGLARRSDPPRIIVKDGTFTLTGEGHKREAEVIGLREMTEDRKKSLGQKLSRREMQVDTAKKMKQLGIWIEMLSKDLSDNMPDQTPSIRAST